MEFLQRYLICALVACALVLFPGCRSTQANMTTEEVSSDYQHTQHERYSDHEPGEMIIQLKSDILQFPAETTGEIRIELVTFQDESFRSLCERAQVVSIQYVYTGRLESLPENMRRTYLFRFREGVEIRDWVRHFEQNPSVGYAEPNQRVYIQEKN